MRTPALIFLASVSLAACVSGPEGGVANYDALAKAQATCVAKGGTLKLQKDADPQFIGNYACERK